MENALTHIDLFAGIGGFSAGFDRCGIKTVAQVEIDKYCQQVLKEHWNIPLLSDVREVGAHNLPYADIITFGSPCQDLSVAGKRNGLSGERSSLFYEAIRIIRELNPRYAIWENVPGALSSNDGADFKAVIEAFFQTDIPVPKSGRWATAGMVRIGERELAWRILDSQYFGVPQRRKRIFLVFCPRGDSATEVLFEPKGVPGDIAQGREKGEGATAATLRSGGCGGVPSSRGEHIVTASYWDGGQISDTLESSMLYKGQMMPEKRRMPVVTVGALQARDYKGVGSQYVNEGVIADNADVVAVGHSGGVTLKVNDKVNTLNAQSGSETTAMFNGLWQMNHASEVYRENGEISPTLQERMGTGGNNIPLVGVRRLTPTECERLQGFSDGWTKSQSDTNRYRQLGNAVTVNVTEWIGRRICRQ